MIILPGQQMNKRVLTDDGSYTYYHSAADEHYHSLSGARQEAYGKYINAIWSFLPDTGCLRVLDVCFGLGYNSAAAFDVISRRCPAVEVRVTALESDAALMRDVAAERNDWPFYHLVRRAAAEGWAGDGPYTIELVLGDARETVLSLPRDCFHAVFFDPFSPRKSPELWTERFFRDIIQVVSPGGALATYSCARCVRDSMSRAGFQVHDGPSIGRRAPSTLAVKPGGDKQDGLSV